MYVCFVLPLALGKGTFAKIFKVTEKAIVKDLVVKEMDRIGYNNLGVEHFISTELDGLRRCGEVSGPCVLHCDL